MFSGGLTLLGKVFGGIALIATTSLIVGMFFIIGYEQEISNLNIDKAAMVLEIAVLKGNNLECLDAFNSQNNAIIDITSTYEDSVNKYKLDTTVDKMATHINFLTKETDEKLTECENIKLVINTSRGSRI